MKIFSCGDGAYFKESMFFIQRTKNILYDCIMMSWFLHSVHTAIKVCTAANTFKFAKLRFAGKTLSLKPGEGLVAFQEYPVCASIV